MCPARTPSGGVRDLWVYVCLCYSIIRKGSATRIRVPLSSSLGGIFGRVCELVTRLGTRATRGNMAALGGDLFVLGIGEGGKGACDNICAWFLPRENVVQGVDDIVFSSGIRWPRLAAHDSGGGARITFSQQGDRRAASGPVSSQRRRRRRWSEWLLPSERRRGHSMRWS